MLYCFLNSDNKEQKYSTLFEALTKFYTPLGKSPLWPHRPASAAASTLEAALIHKYI